MYNHATDSFYAIQRGLRVYGRRCWSGIAFVDPKCSEKCSEEVKQDPHCRDLNLPSKDWAIETCYFNGAEQGFFEWLLLKTLHQHIRAYSGYGHNQSLLDLAVIRRANETVEI